MASGTKSLIQIVKALEALHGQILNVPDVRQQGIDVFGVMCPRWAASEELTAADVQALTIDVVRRRTVQSVRIKDALVVVREILREHDLAESFPASELSGGDLTE